MNALNLCDLLTQSTSFTREMCQKLSRDLTEIFEKTHRRPSFAKFVNRSGWDHSDTDAFLKLVHQAFQEPPTALGPGVYGIINLSPRDDVGHLALRAQEMVNGGVAVVQLRPKNCDTSLIREAAALIQPILQPHNIPFVLNDQAQEAAYLAADGVHVGQTDTPPQTIGHQYPELIVGHSTHTLTQATQAQEDPAVHWVALGPIFESPTKKGHADIVGLESLARARVQTQKPLIAIGGISSAVAAFQIGHTGADYAAVVSAVAHPEYTRYNTLVLNLGYWLGRAHWKAAS